MTLSPEEIQGWLERILLTVQKPGRYVGGELNQVIKPWDSVSTHIALVFPDIYDIGLPNLGLAILYDLLNRRSDTLAERSYAPWVDMEAAMRASGIPLYSLESKHPLSAFDIVGFTLPYETLNTNALNLLDLGGIPLLASNRSSEHPLVIAGGHSAYNPEPMSDFFDAFVIGEGEEVIQEIVDAYRVWRQAGSSRDHLLRSLSKIGGVYVPSLYRAEYYPDGRMAKFIKLVQDAPLPVKKRIVPILPNPPTRFLVPSIDTVHNRIAVEIMRGCTRGCRFCHAGMINRPVRERSVEQIVEAIQTALDQTGYEEIALLSLSSSDYSGIIELVDAAAQRFGKQRLTISLPSLRIESFSVELMDRLKEARPGGGFTLAPEAATDRMRRVINKPIQTEQLLETARAVFNHGWTTLKLYFMIGHPSETIEDVQAIVDLCKAVTAEGRKIVGGRVRVHAGVSTFIPKAHTPFQWVSCDSVSQIRAKQDLLKRQLRGSNLKLSWTQPEETLLEAWLSRGDRRLGAVILRAWQHGAKFDAWQDQYNFTAWLKAFSDAGLDPDFYSHRQREMDELLPWSHIFAGVRPAYLKEEYRRSLEGELRADCRTACFACGILPAYARQRMEAPGDHWKCPEVTPISKRIAHTSARIVRSE
ncbi:MAG: TIGR03960 family B12-binding radical SAM protein [Chloroflexi bacterium]|nr:TIGR03960 family B12-binding radical SAM protein [Chloroflexota bacterium]